MKRRKALVTIASGGTYHADWKRACEVNWQTYARRHGFDLHGIDRLPDTSERARSRSPAWQKCLVPGLDLLAHYDQVVWVDADIVINHHAAPDITETVPVERVGGVEDINYSQADPVAAGRFVERALDYWPHAVINRTAEEYYTRYGLPGGVHRVVNTGVLVLSPRHHRGLFERVYATYEEKGGREWHMEMRPLSYELVKADLVHWIDPRFNLMWPFLEFMHYPYLLQAGARSARLGRLGRWLSAVAGRDRLPAMRKAALNAAYHNAFFLHLGGCNLADMIAIDHEVSCWWGGRS